MKVIVSKILNKTDLAQSGSHGGLVVTKSDQNALKDFFGTVGVYHDFYDKEQEVFTIQYKDYTSNGITPNDRVTPIGRYAAKYQLQPGDILFLEKEESAGEKKYYIEYARRLSSVFFSGKSRTAVDVLNFDQLQRVFLDKINSGYIQMISQDELEMKARYLGNTGTLSITRMSDVFLLEFNGEPISENNKYFELNTAVSPFELKKTNSWRVAIDVDEDLIAANTEADNELIEEVSNIDPVLTPPAYNPIPEPKAPARQSRGRSVPSRSKAKAENALARAGYKCELGDHKTFLRKTNMMWYTEPHHIIPLQFDDWFENSLDVEANIVSLCSNCHNQLHYGIGIESMIRQLWELRKDELEAAGLLIMKGGVELTVDILLNFYDIE